METLKPAIHLKRIAVNRLRSIAYFRWSNSGVSVLPIEKFVTAKEPTTPMFPVRLEKALSLIAQNEVDNKNIVCKMEKWHNE